MKRSDVPRDESGATLILVLIFTVATALIMGALVTLAGTNLLNTANLQSARTNLYAADGAVEAAIQLARYNVSECSPPNGNNIFNYNGLRVDCTEPTSSRSDVVFWACPQSDTTADCPGQALLVAAVAYTDTGCAAPSVGCTATILSWVGGPGTDSGLQVYSVSPNALALGASNRTVTVNGYDFQTGASATISNVTVNSTTYVSSTALTLSVTVPSNATTGPANVSVTNPGSSASATCQNCFTVDGHPTVTSATSATHGPMQTVTVSGTGFVNGSGLVVTLTGNGPAVTVNSTTYTNSTTLTLNVSISGATNTGTYTVNLTNGDGGTASCNNCFSVTAPAVTSLAPSALATGLSSQTVTVTGSGFVSGSGLSIAMSGHSPGVTVNSTTYASSSSLALSISTAGAMTGNYNVTLSNGDGSSATCNNCFTVDAAPTVTSISPSGLGQGSTAMLTITGTNFASSATVGFTPNNGITMSNVVESGGNKITATVTVAASANTGTRTVTVTNPDQGSATGIVTVGNESISLNPTDITTNAQTITVTYSGFGGNMTLQCGVNGANPSNCPATSSASGSGTFSYTPQTGGGNQGQYYRLEVTDGTNAATGIYDVAPVPTKAVIENGSGGMANQIGSGDRIVIGWSDGLNPNTVCSGWSGSGQILTQDMQVTSHGTNDDTLVANGGTCNNLGTIDLGSASWSSMTVDFLTTTIEYCSATGSGLCADPNVSGPAIVIQLGGSSTAPSGTGSVTGVTPTYSPSNNIRTPGNFQASQNPWFGAAFPTTGNF